MALVGGVDGVDGCEVGTLRLGIAEPLAADLPQDLRKLVVGVDPLCGLKQSGQAPSLGVRSVRVFPFIEETRAAQALDNVATRGYVGPMKEVGIRELKDRLSEYVRQVREGEVIMVTDRGKVVAELRPPESLSELEKKYPALAEMARRGEVRLPLKPNGPDAYPRLPSVTPPGTAAKLLDWLREDRRSDRERLP